VNADDLKAALMSNIYAAQDRVQTLCTPVYGVNAKGKFEGVGSATLLDVGYRTFLVTAAHVLDESAQSSLYLPGHPLVEVRGVSYRTSSTLSGRRDDKIDLGVVEMSAEARSRITNVRRVSVASLDPADTPSWLAVYGFVGFPSSRNKARPDGTLQLSSVVVTTTPAANSRYHEIGATPALHIAVEFNRDEASDREKGRVTAPLPAGMSGGGVWRLGHLHDLENEVPPPALIGVGIEYHRKERLLLGIRASFVIASLAACYPELQAQLPTLPGRHRIKARCE
jgi:hypothetical protein